MQFSQIEPKEILPTIKSEAKTCKNRMEFRRKFPKHYTWLWANKRLNLLNSLGLPGWPQRRDPTKPIRNLKNLKIWKSKPQNRIAQNLRTRLYAVLQGSRKQASTVKLVGCSWIELKNHIERQFKPGMSWENYGSWHIDHRRPCAAFNLIEPGEQQKCFHFSNLQPLWKHENYSKGSKFYL